jgi:hypothetical protein
LVDLEVSDDRSPDRKPANSQNADGRFADRGRWIPAAFVG